MCSGCGSPLQSADPRKQGYIPREKLQALTEQSTGHSDTNGEGVEADGEKVEVEREGLVEEHSLTKAKEDVGVEDTSPQPICKRCFSLKHYNSALNITLQADDYLRHLFSLKEKKALILLVVDSVDFPGSLFADLRTLVSPASQVLVVVNKTDLLPADVDSDFWRRFRQMIVRECETTSLAGRPIIGVKFTSVKTGAGLEDLSLFILNHWGNRGDVYLLGCTNVGKSSLFNYLLGSLCGASPGQLATDSQVGAPAATISHWPGTTLGLLSFPIMSVGKRRRLLAQRKAREQRQQLERDGGWLSGEREEEMALERGKHDQLPQNRFSLHDTPGAINEAQVCTELLMIYMEICLFSNQIASHSKSEY